jgi:hypothetical protein
LKTINYETHLNNGILDLSGLNITDDEVPSLCEYLLENPNIYHLNISNNAIGDRGANELAIFLPRVNISSVNLQNNQIEGEGILALTVYLYCTPSHYSLSLLNNPGIDAYATFFYKAPYSLIEGQDWFIEFQLALGYPDYGIKGKCHGIGHMGIQAMIPGIDNFQIFNARLKNMMKIIALARYEVIRKMSKEDSHFANSREKEKIIAEKKNYFKTEINKKTIQKMNALLNGNEQEKADRIDKYAFFDGMNILQDLPKMTQLFKKEDAPNLHNVDFRFQMMMSLALEKTGGLKCIKEFSGAYTIEDLINYFSTLRDSVRVCQVEQNTLPEIIGIVLISLNHTISIGFHVEKGCWILVNANELPAKFIEDESLLAKRVRHAFFNKNNQPTIFNTTIFGSKNNFHGNVDTVIDEWQKKDKFKKIHEVTPEKSKMIDAIGGTWLHSACKIDNTETVGSLLTKGANPYQKTKDNLVPLDYAISFGHPEAAQLVLKKQNFFKTNWRNILGSSLFFTLVCAGTIASIILTLSLSAIPLGMLGAAITLGTFFTSGLSTGIILGIIDKNGKLDLAKRNSKNNQHLLHQPQDTENNKNRVPQPTKEILRRIHKGTTSDTVVPTEDTTSGMVVPTKGMTSDTVVRTEDTTSDMVVRYKK